MLININGQKCYAENGEYILDVAKKYNIDIPTLCDHEAFEGQACCRLCLVEIEDNGKKGVVVSCVYPVKDGLMVFTETPKIAKLRKNILTLLKQKAPGASGRIDLYFEKYGIKVDDSEKNQKCILCGLCTQACKILGNSAISPVGRGIGKEIQTPFNEPAEACIGCLACASVCPCSAIDYSENNGERTIWGKTFTLEKCNKCGKPFATTEEINWMEEKGIELDKLCKKCRRKASVESII